MAHELYIYPPADRPPTLMAQAVVAAFAAAGLPFTDRPDQFEHWLVLDGIESPLYLTIKDGIVTGAAFRFVPRDDESIVQRVADVFKSLGFLVADDEGEL